MSFTLEPSDSLSFTLKEKETTSQSSLKISNTNATDSVLFKVKTTRPLRYLVRPNQGIILPLESATVILVLQAKDVVELSNMSVADRSISNDKFLVQAATVDVPFVEHVQSLGTKEQAETLTEKWSSVEKADTTNKKLRCQFFVEEKTNENGSAVSVAATGVSTSAASSKTTPRNNVSDISNSILRSRPESPKQDQAAAIGSLRKKYDELVTFTVQLTAQRDSLVNELDSKTHQLKQIQETERTTDGLRQRKKSSPGAARSSAESNVASPVGQHIPIYVLFVIAILAFILGKYYS